MSCELVHSDAAFAILHIIVVQFIAGRSLRILGSVRRVSILQYQKIRLGGRVPHARSRSAPSRLAEGKGFGKEVPTPIPPPGAVWSGGGGGGGRG